jgi:hypothetical protein
VYSQSNVASLCSVVGNVRAKYGRTMVRLTEVFVQRRVRVGVTLAYLQTETPAKSTPTSLVPSSRYQLLSLRFDIHPTRPSPNSGLEDFLIDGDSPLPLSLSPHCNTCPLGIRRSVSIRSHRTSPCIASSHRDSGWFERTFGYQPRIRKHKHGDRRVRKRLLDAFANSRAVVSYSPCVEEQAASV